MRTITSTLLAFNQATSCSHGHSLAEDIICPVIAGWEDTGRGLSWAKMPGIWWHRLLPKDKFKPVKRREGSYSFVTPIHRNQSQAEIMRELLGLCIYISRAVNKTHCTSRTNPAWEPHVVLASVPKDRQGGAESIQDYYAKYCCYNPKYIRIVILRPLSTFPLTLSIAPCTPGRSLPRCWVSSSCRAIELPNFLFEFSGYWKQVSS